MFTNVVNWFIQGKKLNELISGKLTDIFLLFCWYFLLYQPYCRRQCSWTHIYLWHCQLSSKLPIKIYDNPYFWKVDLCYITGLIYYMFMITSEFYLACYLHWDFLVSNQTSCMETTSGLGLPSMNCPSKIWANLRGYGVQSGCSL